MCFNQMLNRTGHFWEKRYQKSSPGQMKLPRDEWFVKNEEIEKVALKFILANCYNPQFACIILQTPHEDGQ